MSQLLNKRVLKEWLNEHSGFFYTVNRTLHKGATRFQDLELVDTDEFGNVLLLDGITQVVQKNEWQYHEPMVHVALLAHPDPRSVLVIGGGDGGILREVLRHPSVTHVDFAELDAEVIQFCREYLPGVSSGAFDDGRVHIHVTDGREFVESNPEMYDAVIMDMTDPFGPSQMLYTRQFFEAVCSALRNELAVFCMHTESPIARPLAYRCIRGTLLEVFPKVRPFFTFIQMYATLWSMCVSSVGTDIASISPEEFDSRIRSRGISGLRMITGATIAAMQTAYPYIEELHHEKAPIITDERPDFPDEMP